MLSTGVDSNVTVIVNGKQCDDAVWFNGTADPEGQPYLQCNPRRDVVGPKNVYVCVAGQNAFKERNFEDLKDLLVGERAGAWHENAEPSLTAKYEKAVLSKINTQCLTVNGVKTEGRQA